MRIAPIISLLLAVALPACTPADQADAEPDSAVNEMTGSLPQEQLLKGIRWELASLGGTAIGTDTTAKTPYILLLMDGNRVEGSGSCNGMSGPYELDGRDLQFGPLASTKMACEPGMDVETAFFGALDQTRTWAITGDTLQLSDSTGTVVAQLRAAPDTNSRDSQPEGGS